MPGTWDRDRRPQFTDSGRATIRAEYLPQRNNVYERISVPRTILSWLKTCNEKHGDHCKVACRQESFVNHRSHMDFGHGDRVPLWLIDVYACCITKASRSNRYLALSYVWEAPERRDSHIMLSKESLKCLQEMHSLNKQDKQVPAAIRGAMELAAALGIQYLWVDRLCIVQDDETTKYHQINNMAYIYANAYLTIVAGVGDALDRLEHPLIYFSEPPRKPTREELLNSSKWATRAWTLQELLFSRRAVFFLKGRVVWECHCDIWEEPLWQHSRGYPYRPVEGRCFNRFTELSMGLHHTSWPDMHEYSDIVADYTCRRLTYESDTVPAFLGVTNVLSKSFLGGFIYGLPALFIDAALLWRPSARISRKDTGTQGNTPPSWSWMGWRFDPLPVDTTLWRAACNYVQNSGHWKRGRGGARHIALHRTSLKPTVRWCLGPPEKRQYIRNFGFNWQDIETNPSRTLPDGWRKHSGAFQHSSDPQTFFKYPVPVVNHDGMIHVPTTPCRQLPTTSLLSFKTNRAFLQVRFYCWKNPRKGLADDLAIANIYDKTGNWAGHFRSHDMNLGLNSENYDGQEPLEFIAISEGSERGGSHVFDMVYARNHMDDGGTLKFVNVLWVEWKEGIAYRRGLGHIVKNAWDSEVKEEVDVCLG